MGMFINPLLKSYINTHDTTSILNHFNDIFQNKILKNNPVLNNFYMWANLNCSYKTWDVFKMNIPKINQSSLTETYLTCYLYNVLSDTKMFIGYYYNIDTNELDLNIVDYNFTNRNGKIRIEMYPDFSSDIELLNFYNNTDFKISFDILKRLNNIIYTLFYNNIHLYYLDLKNPFMIYDNIIDSSFYNLFIEAIEYSFGISKIL